MRALLPMFRRMKLEHQGLVDRGRSIIRGIDEHVVSKGLVSVLPAMNNDTSSTSTRSTDDDFNRSYVKLSRDVYSLMYFSCPFGASFFFALGTFIFQIALLVLIMIDIIDMSSANTLSIPSNVAVVVRASQFFAILIVVATQDDLISSFNFMVRGKYAYGL